MNCRQGNRDRLSLRFFHVSFRIKKSLPDPSVREAHQRGTTPVSHSAVHHAGIAKRKAPVLTDKGVIRGTTLHYT